MTGELPEDWFRPARERSAADEAVTDGAAPQRPTGSGPAPTTPASADPTAGELDDERYTDQFKPNYVAHEPRHRVPAAPQPDDSLVTTTGGFHSVGVEPAPVVEEPARPSRRRGRLLGTVVILLATLLVGVGIGRLLTHHDSSSTTDPQATSAPLGGAGNTSAGTPDASPSPTTSGEAPWTGRASTLLPTSITASCTAPSQKGYDGSIIPSNAERMTDGSASTGWRCNGDAKGQSLSFEMPHGVQVVGIKLTNGYTKNAGGIDLYPQYRRITEVTWSFPGHGDAYFEQKLTDGVEQPQEIRIPPTTADDGIKMTIDAVTEPGGSQASRDAVVITDVEFLVK